MVYELNELSWSILDAHVKAHRDGALARVVEEGACFTTVAPAEDPLHPWVTWETLRRGAPAARHGRRFIGQPLASDLPTLADRLVAAGFRVGECGGFGVHERGRTFFIPDPLDVHRAAHPPPLGAVGDGLGPTVRGVGRTPTARLDVAALLRTLPRLCRVGLSGRTLLAAARQLVTEAHDPTWLPRRALLPTRVSFDVFLQALTRYPTDYASFFTNHLAWLLHRYLPEPDTGPAPWAANAALHLVEMQLQALLRRGEPIVLVSSMGQKPAPRRPNLGALTLADPTRLLVVLGVESRRPWEWPWSQIVP